jgi:hypothetical protein
MSEHDIITIVETAIRPHTKAENRKVWVGIFGFVGVMLTVGFVGGDWHAWRQNYTEKVDRLEDWKEQVYYDKPKTIQLPFKNTQQ